MSEWEVYDESPDLTVHDYGDGLGGVVEVNRQQGTEPTIYGHLVLDGDVLWTERLVKGWSRRRDLLQMIEVMQEWLDGAADELRVWADRRAERRYASPSGT